MRFLKNCIALAVISSAIQSPSVLAADTGAYVGLDYVTFNLTNLATGTGQPNGGVRIDAGYNFDKNWGAELGYSFSGFGSQSNGNNYTAASAYLAGVGTYQINDQFDLIGKLGFASNSIAVTGNCTTCSNSGLMYGIGADYNINKQIAVRLQYDELGDFTNPSVGSKVGGSAMSIGAIYKF